MSLERFIQPKSLENKWLSFSPNQEAELLETYLGIHFPLKPKKVVLTARNQLALIAGQPTLEGKLEEIMQAINMRDPNNKGYYDPRLFTYFCKPDADEVFSGLHENMHAYVDLINPSLFTTFTRMKNEIERKKIYRSTQITEPEKFISAHVLHEGLALWGGIATSIKLRDATSDFARQYHLKLIYGGNSPSDMMEIMKFRTAQFIHLDSAVNYFNLSNKDYSNASEYVQKALSVIGSSHYLAGYQFVCLAMREFETMGKSVEQSLKLLITHNPIKIKDFMDGQRYAKNVVFQP